jgi:cellulose synthase/poly-beta-1,6-N-acetylglucosamine synthase-like glycosyltransferase
LQALEAQTYPREFYEVLVIDNGSREPVEPIAAPFRHVRVAHEDRRGSYRARNHGLTLARGDILAFTDSDCVPAADWLERGVAALEAAPDAGLIGGRIDLFTADAQRATAAERFEMIFAFRQQQYIRDEHFAATANVFAQRRIIDGVGPFDDTLQSGGDQDWGKRIHAAGYKLVYADDVRIQHPARRTLGEVLRKGRRTVEGEYIIQRGNGPRPPLWSILRSYVPSLRALGIVYSDPRLKGLWSKTQVAGVYFALRYTRAIHRTRLWMKEK